MGRSWRCSCGEVHDFPEGYTARWPDPYLSIPTEERDQRAAIGEDYCVIDKSVFLIRACLEIPVHGHAEPFIWGVWVSLSEASFTRYGDHFVQGTPIEEPLFSYLCCRLTPYPDTYALKSHVHCRTGIRPAIELEPTDHPLAVEQREGISEQRVWEIAEIMLHGRHH